MSCASYAISTRVEDSTTVGLIIGFSDTVSTSVTVTQEHDQCIDTTITEDCGLFTDSQCHRLWESVEVLRVSGYIRRRCNWYGDGDGDITVWSHDFAFEFPTGTTNPGCKAHCNDAQYPGKELSPDYKPLTVNESSCSSTSNASDSLHIPRWLVFAFALGVILAGV